MSNECKYIETTPMGNYCTLGNNKCDNPTNSNCPTIEEYWKYLEEAGVQIASENEIEELLNDTGTV